MEDNIKKAIWRNEASRPQMPKDLNARLMQRVEKEVNSKPQPKRKRIIWPWVAAACVAALIVVHLNPPKTNITGENGTEVAKAEKDTAKQQTEQIIEQEVRPIIANTKREPQGKKDRNASVISTEETILAKTERTEEKNAESKVVKDISATDKKDLAVADRPVANSTAESTAKPRVLTERDIPITRPENLKYTKEDVALMKKQANEAYLKWIELELEIARYNQEQTALK